MNSSGVQVNPECIQQFNELKLGKGGIKFIIYKLSDDNKEVVVEETSSDASWDVFRDKLLNTKMKDKFGNEKPCPRYAVYDLAYSLEGGEGTRTKITFIAWSPDDASVMTKMTYSSSKGVLRRALNGVAAEVQANDPDDIEFSEILSKVAKGPKIAH